ncbi:MAG: IS5 family transposase [Candidatus Micrarchaeota archaeon]|nr:IS5 family transposase [Candidatus Micrarchaeota archaeon]
MNRGRIIDLYLSSAVLSNKKDTEIVNRNKRGRPFEYSNIVILSSYAIKCVFKLAYRQTEGLIVDITSLMKSSLCPNFRTVWYRIKTLKESGVKLLINAQKVGEKLEVAIDSTGLKNVNDGEYRTKMYRKKKDWTKFHIVVDKNTGRILNAKITNDKAGDGQTFGKVINPIKDRISVVYGDGAYDSVNIWNWCESNSVEGRIPVRINANPKWNGARQSAIRKQFGLPPSHARRGLFDTEGRRNYYRYIWKKKSHYGSRWIVEATFASFKRMFGEAVFSKNWEMKENETLIKTILYNQLRFAAT